MKLNDTINHGIEQDYLTDSGKVGIAHRTSATCLPALFLAFLAPLNTCPVPYEVHFTGISASFR